jgi:CRISPR-associated protein Csm3
MYIKLMISGNIEVLTGMHIGGGNEFSAIGAIDSPVIKDPLSMRPIIPGSSLKGKIRTLLARSMNSNPNAKHSDDDTKIKRLFGSQEEISRLIFRDLKLSNADELIGMGAVSPTEVKFENTINRISGEAMPRQIERSIYPLEIVYQVSVNDSDYKELLEDISTLCNGMRLLQYDYLGGHGTRGYGKIKFSGLNIKSVLGDVHDNILNECKAYLKDVEE